MAGHTSDRSSACGSTEHFRFVISPASRKVRNLAADPRCSLAAAAPFPVARLHLEGDAHELTDEVEVRRVVDAYGSKMQWPLEYRDAGIFTRPTAGPPPYTAFELTPTTCSVRPAWRGCTTRGQPPSGRRGGASSSAAALEMTGPG
jgi:hypothetical protein